ncbi:MAG: iron (metal) dependent repressor, DtxR family [Phycisphaerales bacterium]|nr:iron (metal) dependent repressor, DtxR family [Phycisphaerales bacterium]MDB5358398.1 iron (metal) dependent repressor, DtxR family [Phycisphaerales bacterium]
MATSTVENYLKRLYLEQRSVEGGAMVSMGRLAAAMGVVPGTATSMVKALSDSGLVVYEPRGGVKLTRSGEQLALHVLRRHRLVELFLVKVLGLDWSVVHDEADALEHAISDRVLERIDALLGHPTADPHGDPIPTSKGHLHERQLMSLADCPVGVAQQVARVLDQEPEFLQFIERSGLMPGSTVTVLKRDPAAEAVRIRIPRREELSLGMAAAAKILVDAPGQSPKSS